MKRKLYSFLTLLCTIVLLCGCSLTGFIGKDDSSSVASSTETEASVQASVVESTGTMVVLKVEKAEEDTTLIEVMELLKAENKLDYKITAGMASEINGVANPADFSSCWMLFTSDAELSNTAWGTVEYGGATHGSAIVGAEALTVIAGAYYIWSYQSF